MKWVLKRGQHVAERDTWQNTDWAKSIPKIMRGHTKSVRARSTSHHTYKSRTFLKKDYTSRKLYAKNSICFAPFYKILVTKKVASLFQNIIS